MNDAEKAARHDARDQMLTVAREMRDAADRMERRAFTYASPTYPRLGDVSFRLSQTDRMEKILSQHIADDMHKGTGQGEIYIATYGDSVPAKHIVNVVNLLAEAEDNIPMGEARRQIERMRKAIVDATGTPQGAGYSFAG